jgi:hypothetical protein
MENKQYTSVQDQAKKGLSTFILTLSISLIVFSTIYYLMTNNSTEDETLYETDNQVSMVTEEESDVQGDSTTKTVFGEIAESDPGSYSRQVLAGADEATGEETTTVTETTQSDPNLDTGIASVTIGLVLSLVLFMSAMIFVYKNPRKLALTSFEKKTTKDL